MPGEWNNGQLGNINPDDVGRLRMAAILMGNQNNQGLGGGLANAGSALAGAWAMKHLQHPAGMAGAPGGLAPAMNNQNLDPEGNPVQSYTSQGPQLDPEGNPLGSYSQMAAPPSSAASQGWLGRLFNFGGGS